MKLHRLGICAALLVAPLGAMSESLPLPPLGYADLADLALAAPIAAHVRIVSAARLKPAEAPGLAEGKTRFYVVAHVVSLIRGAAGLPSEISYLVDLRNDSRGRAPRLEKKREFILLAAPVANRPGELRLIAPDAQLGFTQPTAATIRAVLTEATGAAAPQRITGIGKAFHVPGSLPGESETQIFLQSADGRPLSLSVLRRPGETPRWAVALSEIVDEAAAPPARDTLLWYRLACTLPRALPAQSVQDSEAGDVAAIQADYRLVLDALGPCARTRKR